MINSAVFKISKMLKISQITQTKEAQNWQNCVRSMTLKSIAILVATVRQMFVLLCICILVCTQNLHNNHVSFADTYCCPNIGVNSSLYTLPFFLFLFLVATRFVVFGDQNWGDLGGLHSNKSRPELTVSRLTARNAIRVATRTVMFLVWPRPELSCVVTRNKTLSMYRNYMGLCLVFLLEAHFDCFVWKNGL